MPLANQELLGLAAILVWAMALYGGARFGYDAIGVPGAIIGGVIATALSAVALKP